MLLGRKRSVNDPRTLHLHSYLVQHLLPNPPVHQMLDTTSAWPMFANDHFNCCTSAAAGHMVHHWTAANQQGIFLKDDDIIRAHALLTEDHLMEPVSMLDALKFWRNTGIGDHRVHSFIKVGQPKYLFGSAYIGLELPRFAYTGIPADCPDIPWAVPVSALAADTAPQPANGHCVAAIGYDHQFIYSVSWGRLKTMTWDFFERYADEVYAVLSTDWVQRDTGCPTGFDLPTLSRDLSLVTDSVAQQA
jgi:hypothetical protein